MEKYKLRDFAKWAKKEALTDKALSGTLDEMNRGLLGDRLGAHIFKKRIGIAGRGKRGGARTIVVFKQNELSVFIYGYAKNEKSDLGPREEEALRVFAKDLIRLSPAERAERVKRGALVAIKEEK